MIVELMYEQHRPPLMVDEWKNNNLGEEEEEENE